MQLDKTKTVSVFISGCKATKCDYFKVGDSFLYILGEIYYSKKKKILIFFKIVALFLFIAQKIKTAEVIKYHQKKALFVGGKRTLILFGSHVARPHNCQLKRRSPESQKVLWSLTSNMVRGLSG